LNGDEILMCIIAFILGYLVSKHMGNKENFTLNNSSLGKCIDNTDLGGACNSLYADLAMNSGEYEGVWGGYDHSYNECLKSIDTSYGHESPEQAREIKDMLIKHPGYTPCSRACNACEASGAGDCGRACDACLGKQSKAWDERCPPDTGPDTGPDTAEWNQGVGGAGLVVSDSKCDDINPAIVNPDGKVGYYCNGWAPGDYIKCDTPPTGGSAPRCCYHIFANDTCIYNNLNRIIN
jgi:hypothetical protein